MEYDIYKISDKIRNRLGLYIGYITLHSLAVFFIGYRAAMDDIGAKDVSFPPFNKFNSWVGKKYNLGESAAGWQTILLAKSLKLKIVTVANENFYKNISKQQHINSVKLFFELLDEYRAEIKDGSVNL